MNISSYWILKIKNLKLHGLNNLLILLFKQCVFTFKYKQTTALSLYYGCEKKLVMDGFDNGKKKLQQECP